MDIGRFDQTGKAGELIRIDPQEWAFVPNPLPPEGWRLTEQMWPLVTEARAALARLDGIGRTLPDHELLLRPLQRREALRSSSSHRPQPFVAGEIIHIAYDET
jgi:hypothetical protein